MAFQAKCVHCHEAITHGESMLLIGEEPFHRNCGIYRLIGPIENDLGETARKDADAAVSAWEKKRVLELM